MEPAGFNARSEISLRFSPLSGLLQKTGAALLNPGEHAATIA